MSEVDGATLVARNLKRQGVNYMFGIVGFPVGPIAAVSADEDAMRANLAALGFGRLLETGEITQLLRTAGTTVP